MVASPQCRFRFAGKIIVAPPRLARPTSGCPLGSGLIRRSKLQSAPSWRSNAGLPGAVQIHQTKPGARRTGGQFVNTFSFLGIPALLGRTITPEDAKPAAPPVAVLSYKLWTDRFHQDRGMLGRNIILNSKPYTVIGVISTRFGWWDPTSGSLVDLNEWPEPGIRNCGWSQRQRHVGLQLLLFL
jgi:hypothetical protein